MDPKFVLVFVLLPFFAAAEFRVMNTSLGEVTGLVTHVGYGKALHFLGIPFGKPPMGELRFRPPQPAGRFKNGHLNATRNGPSCPQSPLGLVGITNDFNKTTSEDCLNLNIYRPANKSAALWPVMVWIHGGGYSAGAGALYDGRFLAVRGGVLVVTINYRLGLLGFVPNSRTESTLGIQDQILALNWVKNNIRQFGGDPYRVTIFGESAGAQSVSFLTMSPRAKGLFKRAISQSGVAASPFNAQTQAKLDKLKVRVKENGCSLNDVVECLKKEPAYRLLQWASEISPMPVPDGDVIPFDFATNLSHVHPDVDMIMGLNLGDGGLGVVYTCTGLFTKRCNVSRGFGSLEFGYAMSGLQVVDPEEWNSIYDHYNDWYRGPYTAKISLLAADEFGTDYIYRIPTNRTASQMVRRGRNKVYVYQFNSTYPRSMVFWGGDYTKNAPHGADVEFVFGVIPATEHNYQVSNTMVRLWTDFAKGRDFHAYEWPQFSEQFADYLLFHDDQQGGSVRGPLVPAYKKLFWNYYETYGRFYILPTVSNAPISRGLGLAYAVMVFGSLYYLL